MSDIKVRIYGEFDKKGFKNAERATGLLDKSFKRLGGTIGSVFAARKLIQFTSASVKAFADEDRAVRSLATSMNNLGLAFEGAGVEDFISSLQRNAAVSDDVLRPAFQRLVNATLDVTKSQQLLGLALDISAATGKDLSAVTNALSRAYLKDLSALSKLNIGLTAAQLKTMSFAEAQQALTDRFGGQAAAAADSYQGKINALNIAFDEAKETIGRKFIRALELLGEGDFGKVLDTIASAADKVGNAFVRASYGVQKLKALLKGDFDQIKQLQEAMNIELAGFGTRLGAAGAVQKMAQQLKLQKQIVAERKRAAALAEKEKKNQEALTKAKSALDLEKIQIEAALKGKISEEERTRLLLMKAIANENGAAAEDLLKKLKEIQAENEKLSKQLTEFPKANDPFMDWTKSLAAVQLQLSAIQQKKIVIDFIQNFVPSTSTIPMPNNAAVDAATKAAAAAAEAAAKAMKEADALAAAAAKATADARAAETAAAAAAAKAATDAIAATGKAQSDALEAISKAQAEAAAAAASDTAKAQSDALAAIAKAQADAAAATAAAAAAEAKAQSDALAAIAKAQADAAAAAAAAEAKAKADYEAALAALKATEAAPKTDTTKNIETAASVAAAVAAIVSDPAVVADIVTAAVNSADTVASGSVSLAPIDAIDYTNFFAYDPMAGYNSGAVNIVVNVAGSVTAEDDLAKTILNTFYDYQDSGQVVSIGSNTIR